jgi:TRAP-type C4-dicarboxylate transport system permease small subunit
MQSVLTILRRVEALVATVAYAIVAGLLMTDVIGRELFRTSFLGADQLAVYGAILAGFLGLTLATSDNAHLRPGFMDFVFAKHEALIVRVGDAVSALFFVGAAYIAWTFVAVSMEAQDRAPVFYFVVWPLQIIIPYAFLSCAAKHAIFSLRPELKPVAGQAH